MTENEIPDSPPKLPNAEPSEQSTVSDQASTSAKEGEVGGEPRRPRNPRFGRKGGKFGPKRPRSEDGSQEQVQTTEDGISTPKPNRHRSTGRSPHPRTSATNKDRKSTRLNSSH